MIKGNGGSVLPLSMLMLALLSLMGIIATRTTQIELQISGNNKFYTQAFYYAESGLAVSRAVINEIDDVKTHIENNTDWCGKIIVNDPAALTEDACFDYSEHIAFVNNLKFDVWMRFDRDSDNNVVMENDYPVILVDSQGHGPAGARVVTAVRLVRDRLFLKPNAPLYAGGNLVDKGNAATATADNDDVWCEDDEKPDYDIITTDNAEEDLEADDWTGSCPETNAECALLPDGPPYDVNKAVSNLWPIGRTIDPGTLSPGEYLNNSDNPEIFRWTGGKTNNDVRGYGMLLIDGDVEFAGNIEWYGLILITGNSVLSGGGTKEIMGAFVGNQDVRINGSVDIKWDCRAINDLLAKYGVKYLPTWWMQR